MMEVLEWIAWCDVSFKDGLGVFLERLFSAENDSGSGTEFY